MFSYCVTCGLTWNWEGWETAASLYYALCQFVTSFKCQRRLNAFSHTTCTPMKNAQKQVSLCVSNFTDVLKRWQSDKTKTGGLSSESTQLWHNDTQSCLCCPLKTVENPSKTRRKYSVNDFYTRSLLGDFSLRIYSVCRWGLPDGPPLCCTLFQTSIICPKIQLLRSEFDFLNPDIKLEIVTRKISHKLTFYFCFVKSILGQNLDFWYENSIIFNFFSF